jgi:putative oxidoreductase
MITELTCSTLLMLGIVTRGATLPLLPMLLVLLLVYPVDWPNNLLWRSILLFLLTRGTGRFSVDRTIERHFVARGRYQWTDVHIVLGAQARRCHVIEGV